MTEFALSADPRTREALSPCDGVLIVWTLGGAVEIWHEGGARICFGRHQGDQVDALIDHLTTVRREQQDYETARRRRVEIPFLKEEG